MPELVVEILSPGTKSIDQGQKRRIYERNGVLEYWLIDPASQNVRQLVSSGSRFDEERVLWADDVLASKVLPGLRIRVAELFPEA